jgi:putative colanic acid biosynthesis acetyltransferase WcaF
MEGSIDGREHGVSDRDDARSALARRLRDAVARQLWAWQLSFLRLQGAHIDRGVRAFGRVRFVGDPRNLTVGPSSTLNQGVFMNLRDRIDVGADVHLSPYVQLHTGELMAGVIPRSHRQAPIVIEDHAWVASGAIVGAGVRIGRAAVVGAGAVVTEDVPAETFVAGIPAKPIRRVKGSGNDSS